MILFNRVRPIEIEVEERDGQEYYIFKSQKDADRLITLLRAMSAFERRTGRTPTRAEVEAMA